MYGCHSIWGAKELSHKEAYENVPWSMLRTTTSMAAVLRSWFGSPG